MGIINIKKSAVQSDQSYLMHISQKCVGISGTLRVIGGIDFKSHPLKMECPYDTLGIIKSCDPESHCSRLPFKSKCLKLK